MRNIVLVGFMGTGKTAVAKALSRRLNMKYVSTDCLIEKKEKISISDIFSKKGESYFRKAENDAVKEASFLEGAVIDAGGGAVIDPENVRSLKKKGTLVCLWASPEVILERTKRGAHRPLLNVAEPLKEIAKLLDYRKQFYERADHHIHTSGIPVEKVAGEIERILKDEEAG